MIDELKALAPPGVDVPWRALQEAYATGPRAYHTLEHVLDVARHWASETWRQPNETFLAILFHDAVYVAGSSDNEEKSARFFESLCGKNDRVTQLIGLTALHGKALAVDDEAAKFLDCDMAILGAPPEAFDRYEQQVAQEYVPVVGEDAYASGRRRFLERLLQADRIFLSGSFHARFDAQARDNLRRALR